MSVGNFSRFKRGDKVKTTYGGTGVVERTFRDSGKFKAMVKLDSGATLQYDETQLTFDNSKMKESKSYTPEEIGDKCPICSTEWTVTSFGNKKWKDCLPCGDTAENLLEKHNKSKNKSTGYKDIDPQDDWYNVLNEWGSD